MSETFSALGVSVQVQEVLAKRGITEPFRIQTLVVPDALAGRDILAKSPTGSGKTLAFGLPIVERIERGGQTPQALLLVPTRELAQQVAQDIESFAPARGPRVPPAHGGAPGRAQAQPAPGAAGPPPPPGPRQGF